jgi:hypothetical protein
MSLLQELPSNLDYLPPPLATPALGSVMAAGTQTAVERQLPPSSTAPIDWSLKTTARFSSPTPFAISEDAQLASGKEGADRSHKRGWYAVCLAFLWVLVHCQLQTVREKLKHPFARQHWPVSLPGPLEPGSVPHCRNALGRQHILYAHLPAMQPRLAPNNPCCSGRGASMRSQLHRHGWTLATAAVPGCTAVVPASAGAACSASRQPDAGA